MELLAEEVLNIFGLRDPTKQHIREHAKGGYQQVKTKRRRRRKKKTKSWKIWVISVHWISPNPTHHSSKV
jgi:hypothetical protein